VNGRGVEILCLAVIAVAVLVGGRSVLVQISHYHAPAAAGLALIGVALSFGLRRELVAGGPMARLRASSAVAFAAAIVSAIAFVLWPARWSLGAAIAALEFGLILELFARFAPGTPTQPEAPGAPPQPQPPAA
jgi:hypothetical protein